MEFIREFWAFLRVRKKLWLAPIIIIMVVLGGLIILTEGTVIAPIRLYFILENVYPWYFCLLP